MYVYIHNYKIEIGRIGHLNAIQFLDFFFVILTIAYLPPKPLDRRSPLGEFYSFLWQYFCFLIFEQIQFKSLLSINGNVGHVGLCSIKISYYEV